MIVQMRRAERVASGEVDACHEGRRLLEDDMGLSGYAPDEARAMSRAENAMARLMECVRTGDYIP